jgi:hypothetical protein
VSCNGLFIVNKEEGSQWSLSAKIVRAVATEKIFIILTYLWEESAMSEEKIEPRKVMGLVIYLASIFVASCVATPEQIRKENELKFSSMSFESVDVCTTVENAGDNLANVYIFSSRECYIRKHLGHGLIKHTARVVWNDFFVKARKNMSTGEIKYHVGAILKSPEWSYPQSATYELPQNDETKKHIRVNTNTVENDSKCSGPSYQIHSICDHIEHITFPLEKSYLKALSDNFDTLPKEQMMTIHRRTGCDVNVHFNITELVGFYRKVEAYQSQDSSN